MTRPGTSLHLNAVQQQRLSLGQLRMLHLLALPLEELERHIDRLAMENPLLEAEVRPGEQHGLGAWASFDGEEVGRLPAPALSWREDLLQQARLLPVAPSTRRTVQRLILELDDDGLLRGSVEDLAHEWSEDARHVAASLALLQGLEPAGVGARTRREALTLQWVRLHGEGDPLSQIALALLDLEPGASERLDPEALARRLGVSGAQIRLVLERLRRLSPSPVAGAVPSPPIRPDLSVWLEDGRVQVEVYLPGRSLAINPEYRALAGRGDLEEDERAYLRHNLQEARWVLGGLRRRQATLRMLSLELFTVQRPFLERGLEALQPLRRYHLADRLHLHPSTVGRALAGKTAVTPWGVHPFERFFPRSVPRRFGDPSEGPADQAVTSSQVRAWIQRSIAEEDPSHPRTDASLAREMTGSGVALARRTVAKYREEMGIPSSRQRRPLAPA
ncbi:RNA polymerase factor sigma-54 [Limnochorda pilosa]|uniref:RNA polymerase sigma-54 factor n=1 Tax=Limnochorda pilosa TaxID=1555112 RepID=A0A0K2SLE3_LIMPI|nr:hypothetical protein [Limnochorda pilosa]BAS27946.1 hypothetical protein LIP_2105 [Limnochorda pilosa]